MCSQQSKSFVFNVVAIFGVVYLSISLLTSLFMNWFNTKMALKER